MWRNSSSGFGYTAADRMVLAEEVPSNLSTAKKKEKGEKVKSVNKRAGQKLALIAFLLGWSFIAQASTFVDRVPEGLPPARENSESGVLGSNFQSPSAIFYQEILNALESKVFGLDKITHRNRINQAEIIYEVEALALGIYQRIANDRELTSQFERDALMYRAQDIYQETRHHGERMFETMIRIIDAAKPGTSGIQLPTVINDGDVTYAPNYRFEHKLTVEEQRQAYAKKLAEFEAEGGKLTEVKVVNKASIAALPQVARVEFVEMANGEIRFTQGSAGHILMAQGEQVTAAGTMLLVKDASGKLMMAVISNSSGSFKPDMVHVEEFAHRFSRKVKLPREHVVMTRGEPLSGQIVKILMKAEGEDKATIKTRVARANKTAEEARTTPFKYLNDEKARARVCRALFSTK